MRRSQAVLAGLALAGWTGALAAQITYTLTGDEAVADRWSLWRNRCLLLSSLAMNTLVLRTVYRYASRFRHRRNFDRETDARPDA